VGDAAAGTHDLHIPAGVRPLLPRLSSCVMAPWRT
jgi:hypothetical protein